MRIYGLDFTSAPRNKKPITCVQGTLSGNVLTLEEAHHFTKFEQFEAFLETPGPWVAAIDFPFAQPQKLIRNLNWPLAWPDYVQPLSQMTMKEFEAVLTEYRQARPSGDKQHMRAVDTAAQSCSPMMLYGVPVARMFFQGAPRLLNAPVSIHPMRPMASNRIVLEGYPALVARRFVGKQPYKTDDKKKQTLDKQEARRQIVEGLISQALEDQYGVSLSWGRLDPHELILDPTADKLDAILCAVQAAWGYMHRNSNFGIPEGVDASEGWIVEPDLMPLNSHWEVKI